MVVASTGLLPPSHIDRTLDRGDKLRPLSFQPELDERQIRALARVAAEMAEAGR